MAALDGEIIVTVNTESLKPLKELLDSLRNERMKLDVLINRLDHLLHGKEG